MLKSLLTFDAIANLEPWIQVDLLTTKTIHSIATQGMERWSSTLRWTKMYHVKYGDSEDDLSYVVDDNGPIVS